MDNFPPIETQIQDCQKEIVAVSTQLRELKYKLKSLQHNQSMNAGIKWVDEIRRCLIDADNKPRAVSISTIIFNIRAAYGIAEDRNMRNKVATTLSRLFKDKTIYKTEYRGKTVYGYPEIFNDDKITLKKGTKIIAMV